MDGKAADTGLPKGHPLIAFAGNPENLSLAQALDDAVFWGSLELMSQAGDKAVASLARRLRDRDLFKAIDIFTDEILAEAHGSGDKDFLNKIGKRIEEVLGPKSNNDNEPPSFLIDRPTRPIYKEFDKSKGPLNQIVVRMADGTLRDVANISPVISAIGDFDVLRVYVDKNDSTMRKAVSEAAKEAIQHARAN